MNKINIYLSFIIIGMVIINGCGKNETNVQINNQQTPNKNITGTSLPIDISTSKIEWEGKKVTGKHHGTINIANGELIVDGDKISGGRFEIDMTNIKNLDLTDEESNTKLVTHLKSADFFDVSNYPVTKFEITKVEPINDASKPNVNASVTGNLTIKNITKNITFPANIKIDNNKVSATADINIDRTLWEVKYRSGKFFENLGDKMIDDIFNLHIDIKTK